MGARENRDHHSRNHAEHPVRYMVTAVIVSVGLVAALYRSNWYSFQALLIPAVVILVSWQGIQRGRRLRDANPRPDSN